MAIQFLHEHGIAHLDIKPQNLAFDEWYYLISTVPSIATPRLYCIKEEVPRALFRPRFGMKKGLLKLLNWMNMDIRKRLRGFPNLLKRIGNDFR